MGFVQLTPRCSYLALLGELSGRRRTTELDAKAA
jgi:hypothetical protein